MKVAYILNQYPKVSHTFIRREILALERLGLEITRIALRGWNEACPDPRDDLEKGRTRYVLKSGILYASAITVLSLLLSPRRSLSAVGLAFRMSRYSHKPAIYHVFYFVEACVVSRWVLASGASHMHAHFGTNAAEVCMLASKLSTVPYSFTVHGPEEFDAPKSLGLGTLVQHASKVVGISSFCRGQLMRWIDPGQWDKLSIVRCGVDSEFLSVPRVGVGSDNRLLCVGRLSAEKGQLLLLSALDNVIRRGGECSLVLAGDGPMRGLVQQQISRLKLGDRVQITGWISGHEVLEEVKRARALVLPSLAEGLPVVIMEAMAMARPVISTYIAGIPELVTRECGWLVPSGDQASLEDAIIECLRASPSKLDEMGNIARQRVAERHDVDREAERLALVFGARGGS